LRMTRNRFMMIVQPSFLDINPIPSISLRCIIR
jgi:hypothetical protein